MNFFLVLIKFVHLFICLTYFVLVFLAVTGKLAKRPVLNKLAMVMVVGIIIFQFGIIPGISQCPLTAWENNLIEADGSFTKRIFEDIGINISELMVDLIWQLSFVLIVISFFAYRNIK